MPGAPIERGFGTAMGKSVGVAVTGIMPTIARTKAAPDSANQSGQPWPAADDDDHLNVSDAWVGAAADSPPLSTFAGGLWGCVAYCRLEFDAPSDGIWRAELTWIHAEWGGSDGSADQVRAETGEALQFRLTAPHTYRSLSSFQARPYLTLRFNGSAAGSPSATADTLRIEIDCDRLRGPNGLQDATP